MKNISKHRPRGPMLWKLHRWRKQTDKQTDTWTWRLYDQLGPEGPSWWKLTNLFVQQPDYTGFVRYLKLHLYIFSWFNSKINQPTRRISICVTLIFIRLNQLAESGWPHLIPSVQSWPHISDHSKTTSPGHSLCPTPLYCEGQDCLW